MEKSGVEFVCEIPPKAKLVMNNEVPEVRANLWDFAKWQRKFKEDAKREGYNERKRKELQFAYTPFYGSRRWLYGNHEDRFDAHTYISRGRAEGKTAAYVDEILKRYMKAMEDMVLYGTGSCFIPNYFVWKEGPMTIDHPKEVISNSNGKTYPVVGVFQNDYYVIRASNGNLHIGHKNTFTAKLPKKWINITDACKVQSDSLPYPDVSGKLYDDVLSTESIRGPLGRIIAWMNPYFKRARHVKYRFVEKDVYLAEEVDRVIFPYGAASVLSKRKAFFVEEEK